MTDWTLLEKSGLGGCEICRFGTFFGTEPGGWALRSIPPLSGSFSPIGPGHSVSCCRPCVPASICRAASCDECGCARRVAPAMPRWLLKAQAVSACTPDAVLADLSAFAKTSSILCRGARSRIRMSRNISKSPLRRAFPADHLPATAPSDRSKSRNPFAPASPKPFNDPSPPLVHWPEWKCISPKGSVSKGGSCV